MTLRAEDFTLQGQMKQNRALESVELMNRGVETKDYSLYQQGVDGLMGEFGKDIPHLQQRMKRQMFLMDAVARFVDEVQGIEMGLEYKPFQTRIGIGELFMNPTLEVVDVKTGMLIAVFEKVDAYRLLDSCKSDIERAQDGFIAGQKRRSELQRQVSRIQAVLAEPGKMLRTTYDDLLIDPWEEKFGKLRNLYLPILRIKHAEYYGTPAGQQVLQNEISDLEIELADVQDRLDTNAEMIDDIRKSEGQVKEVQEVFVALMNEYQVPRAKTYPKASQTA